MLEVRRRWPWMTIGLVACGLAFVHPWLSPTMRSGTDTLVVEGWMPKPGLHAASQLFHEGGYRRVWVTGAFRPFGYWLHAGDTLVVLADPILPGTVSLQVAGLPGVRYSVELNGQRMQGPLQAEPLPANLPSAQGGLRSMKVFPAHEGVVEHDAALLFAVHLKVDGMDLHQLPAHIAIHRATGDTLPGTPTHAAHGAALLAGLGIPLEVLTSVPVQRATDRTRSAAEAIALRARSESITGFDVATQGVHARRTWTHFRRAAHPLAVGVIAMDDPECRRWSWWLHRHGWTQVLKELLAIPLWLIAAPPKAPHTTMQGELTVSSAHAAIDPPRP